MVHRKSSRNNVYRFQETRSIYPTLAVWAWRNEKDRVVADLVALVVLVVIVVLALFMGE